MHTPEIPHAPAATQIMRAVRRLIRSCQPLLLAAVFLPAATLRAADFFVVQANGAGGAYTSVNDAIAAAVASSGGASGDTIEIRSNTAGQLQVFAQTINLSSVNISSTDEADWLTIRVRSGDKVRFRASTSGALISATGTSRGWKVEGNSLGPISLQFGDRADYVHTGLNTYENCYPHKHGANIASTCSNYAIRRAQFSGADDFTANIFDGTDYVLEDIALYDHGTNHYDINPNDGDPQDWGDGAEVRGNRVKLTGLTSLHGGHNGWVVIARNAVVRDCDFSGYWADISPSPGARAMAVLGVAGASPYGPVLMEGVILRDSANSVDNTAQPAMKSEANRLIIRDSFFFDIDSHLWQMNFTKAKTASTSYFSDLSFYHNTSYISKGTWWNNFSSYNSASGNAQFERNLIANNLFQEVSDNDKTSSPAQILQYDTSLITTNGYPNGFHGTIISGNAVGGPSALKRVNLKTSSGNTTFAIDSPPSSPVNLTGNVFSNVITAVTFDDVGSPRNRTKEGFAVTNWGSGASAGDAPPLTTITANSSGSTITVANAQPFFDGWGVRGEAGDYLYIGSTASAAESAGPVQISSINYGTKQITLTASRSVTSGQGVWFGGNPATGSAAIRKNRGAHIPGSGGGSPPTAPSNLTATVDSGNPSGQINLSWTDNSSDETQFVLQRKPAGGSYGAWSVNKAANSTSHNDSTVSASTSYTYRVRAENSAGASAWSNEDSATTSGSGTPTVYDANALTIVTATDSTSTVSNAGALNGNFLRLNSNAVNDSITFDVSVPATGVYQISVRVHRNAWRGIAQLAIDNGSGFVNLGSPQDLYAATAGFADLPIGTVALTAGTRQFRFTLTGKNGSSADYELALDSITLTPGSDLVAWLKFDDGSGTSAADSSGSGNTGTLVNGATWTTGQLSGAVNLDGTNDHVTLPSGMADFSNGMTIAVWAYPETVKDSARFIDFGNGSSSNNIILGRAGTSNTLRFRVYNGSTSGTAVDASNAIALNTWQHFAVTIDSSGNVTLYKNGTQVATGTTNVPVNITRTSNFVGRSNWSTDAYFDGKLDDLRVYNRVLTSTEIAALP